MASLESQRVRATFVKTAAPPMSLEEERQAWEAGALQTPLPDGVTFSPETLNGVRCAWVRAENAAPERVLLHLHGGGFSTGSPITHRDIAARLSLASGMSVLLVDYALAPEAPYPQGIEDTVHVYRSLRERGSDPRLMAVSADSAGASVALAALLRLRDLALPMPRAVVLMSAWVDLTMSGDTMQTRANVDPMVTRDDLRNAAGLYIQGADAADPLASPLFAELRGLPPMLIQAGDHEVLLSDSTRLAAKAEAAGIAVRLSVWDAMWHFFQAWGDLPEAQAALDEIGAFLRERWTVD